MLPYRESKENRSIQKEGLREANKSLQAAIKKFLDENMENIKEELKDAGVPEEEYQKHIDNIRRKLQLEAIRLFKEELQLEIEELKKQRQTNTSKV